MSKRIGFANQFFTLWNVSKPYKHYFNEYAYEWRTDLQYIQNLSKDEKAAQDKAVKFGAVCLEVDEYLRGRSSSFFTSGDKGIDYSNTPEYIYPAGIHRDGRGDIRDFLSPDSPILHVDQIKALWTLYLKKDICFGTESISRPEWRRPVVYARRKLLDAGILVRYDGRVLAASYLEKYKAQQETKALEAGLFFNDKERIEIELKEMSSRHFEGVGAFGEYSFFIITYTDRNGRAFYYKGSSVPQIPEGDFLKVKATVKHSVYNGTMQTNLQRFHINK
jgi:hypothetical protein